MQLLWNWTWTVYVSLSSCVEASSVKKVQLKVLSIANIWQVCIHFWLTEAFECNVSYDYQIERKFPLPGVSLEGYCGEKFASTPPLPAPQALNSKYNVDNNTTEHFIECRGTPQVISSSFLSGVAWIIPFCISSMTFCSWFIFYRRILKSMDTNTALEGSQWSKVAILQPL